MSRDPIERAYPETTEFLDYWFGQAHPVPSRDPEEIAVRAALDQQPQLIQRVRRELKLLLKDPAFVAWVMRQRILGDEAEAVRWVVQIIRGLTEGLRMRDTTGRVELGRPVQLPSETADRRHGWRERKSQRRRLDAGGPES